MAAFDFPAAPTVGQTYGVYTWDGEKWLFAPGSRTIIASDTPPANAADNTLWFESDTGVLYFRFNDGDSSQWVSVIGAPGMPDGVVRYDAAQALTAAQQAQARSNVFAAPFDALACNGIQINGGMEVSQDKGGTATSTGGQYVIDGWVINANDTAVVSAQQITAAFFAGFPCFVQVAVATAQPVMSAASYYSYQHRIEGRRFSRLNWGTANAQPLTLGFWTAHNRVGTYSVSVRNAAGNRSYVATYTQNVATTQEYKTVTIPGCTDGTWLADNSLAVLVDFTIASGSNSTAASVNTWLATNTMAASTQTNGVTATSDIFRIGGVVMLPGNEAPSAARSALILRPFDQELLMCQRYYEAWDTSLGFSGQYNPVAVGVWASTSSISAMLTYKVRKRATPTISNNGLANFVALYNAGNSPVGLTSLGVGGANLDGAMISANVSSAVGTAGQGGYIAQNVTVGAKMIYDARL